MSAPNRAKVVVIWEHRTPPSLHFFGVLETFVFVLETSQKTKI